MRLGMIILIISCRHSEDIVQRTPLGHQGLMSAHGCLIDKEPITIVGPVLYQRVCQAWHRANGVQVPVPGLSGAEG